MYYKETLNATFLQLQFPIEVVELREFRPNGFRIVMDNI